MINKLKFFFKKLNLKETEYNILVYKSNCFDNMISCIHISKEIEPIYAKNGRGINILRFDKVINFIVSVNMIDMLKSAGFTLDKSVKWDITTDNK